MLRAKADAHKIHYLMVLLLAVKALTLLSQAFMFHTISIFGDAEGWNIAFYVLTGAALRCCCSEGVVCAATPAWGPQCHPSCALSA